MIEFFCSIRGCSRYMLGMIGNAVPITIECSECHEPLSFRFPDEEGQKKVNLSLCSRILSSLNSRRS